MVWFFIAGVPQQQGSKTAYVVAGRAVVADQNRARLKPWRAQVASASAEAWAGLSPLDGPVKVVASFVLSRPRSVRRSRPHVRPDLDKLSRALLDGISDAGCVWRDDAQVVELKVEKVYGTQPGVHVSVVGLGDAERSNNQMEETKCR